MSRIMIIALVILGLVLGIIVGWLFNTGATMSLFIGVLLVVAGAVAGFVIEWIIDEAVRKNRELRQQMVDGQGSQVQPIVVEGNVIPPTRDTELLMEVVHQLRALREAPAVTAGQPQNQDNLLLTEILHQLRTLRETPAKNDVVSVAAQKQDAALTEIMQQLKELRESSAAPAETPVSKEDDETLAEILRQHSSELHQLGVRISAKDSELESLRQKFGAYQKSHPDELTQIKGIGPVYQRKLRDIGFSSYSQLAQADPSQIRRMLDIKKWQKVDIESWVQQARDWAEHS